MLKWVATLTMAALLLACLVVAKLSVLVLSHLVFSNRPDENPEVRGSFLTFCVLFWLVCLIFV